MRSPEPIETHVSLFCTFLWQRMRTLVRYDSLGLVNTHLACTYPTSSLQCMYGTMRSYITFLTHLQRVRSYEKIWCWLEVCIEDSNELITSQELKTLNAHTIPMHLKWTHECDHTSFKAPALYPWRFVRRTQFTWTPRSRHNATLSSTNSRDTLSVESSKTYFRRRHIITSAVSSSRLV